MILFWMWTKQSQTKLRSREKASKLSGGDLIHLHSQRRIRHCDPWERDVLFCQLLSTVFSLSFLFVLSENEKRCATKGRKKEKRGIRTRKAGKEQMKETRERRRPTKSNFFVKNQPSNNNKMVNSIKTSTVFSLRVLTPAFALLDASVLCPILNM